MSLGIHPAVPHPPILTVASYESVLADLYRKGVIDRTILATAIVTLKLPHAAMARELGLSSAKELLSEFLDPAGPVLPIKPGWEPWSFEHARIALFDPSEPHDVAPKVGKTPKAVRMFRYRMFTQGCRINRAVWELLMEGHSPEEIVELGFNQWMAEFASMVHQLQIYGASHHRSMPIKIVFT
jgi:hypothetical protein